MKDGPNHEKEGGNMASVGALWFKGNTNDWDFSHTQLKSEGLVFLDLTSWLRK